MCEMQSTQCCHMCIVHAKHMHMKCRAHTHNTRSTHALHARHTCAAHKCSALYCWSVLYVHNAEVSAESWSSAVAVMWVETMPLTGMDTSCTLALSIVYNILNEYVLCVKIKESLWQVGVWFFRQDVNHHCSVLSECCHSIHSATNLPYLWSFQPRLIVVCCSCSLCYWSHLWGPRKPNTVKECRSQGYIVATNVSPILNYRLMVHVPEFPQLSNPVPHPPAPHVWRRNNQKSVLLDNVGTHDSSKPTSSRASRLLHTIITPISATAATVHSWSSRMQCCSSCWNG